MSRYQGGVCSKCEAKYDGCIDLVDIEDPECRPDGATSIADDGSTDGSATTPTTDTIADDSATSTGGAESTGDVEGSSSSGETGIPVPECGNGIAEDENNENCDGEDLGPFTSCDQVGLGAGELGCNASDHPSGPCKYNLDGCASDVTRCGDQMVEGIEQCESPLQPEETCESLSPTYIGGTLTCEMCQYNTSDCDLCQMSGEPCSADEPCCAGLLCGVVSHTCAIL